MKGLFPDITVPIRCCEQPSERGAGDSRILDGECGNAAHDPQFRETLTRASNHANAQRNLDRVAGTPLPISVR